MPSVVEEDKLQLKNKKAVSNDVISSEVIKFASACVTADHDVNIPLRLYAYW